MARKVGQIIARGDRRWLIRVYLGRDHEIKKRNYHNVPCGKRKHILAKKLHERDLGRHLEGAKITLNDQARTTKPCCGATSGTQPGERVWAAGFYSNGRHCIALPGSVLYSTTRIDITKPWKVLSSGPIHMARTWELSFFRAGDNAGIVKTYYHLNVFA
jgi:hypothetical protein